MIKIAHISDLHFYKTHYHPSQFFSKRWIGNINAMFLRKKVFKPDQIWLLPDFFEKLKIDYVVVSGDISSTSLKEEFALAKKIFDEFHKKGIKTFIVPGNHDHYTKKAHRDKLFYDFFKQDGSNKIEKKFSLKKDGVEAKFLKDGWWFVGLDCTLATSLTSSRGVFSKEIENNFIEVLRDIPKEDFIILINHFPFLKSPVKRKELVRSDYLLKIIQENPNIKIYLHGHTHHHAILDLRDKNLPIVLDSGSSSHNFLGKWNLLEIDQNINVSVFEWINKKNIWQKTQERFSYD